MVPESALGELGGLGSTSLLSERSVTDLVKAISSKVVEMAVVCNMKLFTKQLLATRD